MSSEVRKQRTKSESPEKRHKERKKVRNRFRSEGRKLGVE